MSLFALTEGVELINLCGYRPVQTPNIGVPLTTHGRTDPVPPNDVNKFDCGEIIGYIAFSKEQDGVILRQAHRWGHITVLIARRHDVN